jgi:hypothetical protein
VSLCWVSWCQRKSFIAFAPGFRRGQRLKSSQQCSNVRNYYKTSLHSQNVRNFHGTGAVIYHESSDHCDFIINNNWGFFCWIDSFSKSIQMTKLKKLIFNYPNQILISIQHFVYQIKTNNSNNWFFKLQITECFKFRIEIETNWACGAKFAKL